MVVDVDLGAEAGTFEFCSHEAFIFEDGDSK